MGWSCLEVRFFEEAGGVVRNLRVRWSDKAEKKLPSHSLLCASGAWIRVSGGPSGLQGDLRRRRLFRQRPVGVAQGDPVRLEEWRRGLWCVQHGGVEGR